MKKLLTLFVFILFAGVVNAQTISLDNVNSGSLPTWYQYYSGYNPVPTYQEIVSPYDGSTAIKTSVYGNTLMYCDTKYIHKTYDMHSTYTTENTELKAYLEFSYDGTYYNFPYVVVQLLNQNDELIGQHVWYGKNIVGGHYYNYILQDPESYTEFPSDKGYFTMDLSEIGSDIEYRKIRVNLQDYTCIGTNSIIIDDISFVQDGNGGNDEQEVPEFGIIAGIIAVIGALGIFVYTRRN
ncbi:MAG: hypothetical protein ACP5NV_06325 [Candidatus Woesearchaeota archaeon]